MDEFTKLYLARRPSLAKLVRRILRFHPPEEIEDVLQDLWLRCSQAYAARPVPFFKAWIDRAAINLSINRIRRFKHEPQPEKIRQGALPRQLIDRDPRPDELVMNRDLRKAIANVVRRAPKLIETVRLLYLEGHSCAEVAAILDITEGTVKSNAHKAVARLRESLTAPEAA